MSFSVSTLTNYTKENEALLVSSSVLGAKTASLIKSAGNVMVGVKSAETINIMDTDAFFQAGGTCGWNASGTTSFTQRTVTVGKIKVQESLCPKALEAKYLQKALPTGSQYDSIPFEQDYSDRKAKVIAAQLETAIWQGDTGSANGNLNKFDGLIKLIGAASGVVDANVSGFVSGAPLTSITASNTAGEGNWINTQYAPGTPPNTGMFFMPELKVCTELFANAAANDLNFTFEVEYVVEFRGSLQ